MKEFLAAIRTAARSLSRPYRVRINWDGETYTHRAPTVADALHWAAQYPESATATVTTRSGQLVSQRTNIRPSDAYRAACAARFISIRRRSR